MRMRFKASMPDPRILIIQIVVVAVLASVFRNLLALFLLVLIVDFLLLLQCGWAVFWKNLLSYAAMLLILFALQEIYIPIISDLFPLFLLLLCGIPHKKHYVEFMIMWSFLMKYALSGAFL